MGCPMFIQGYCCLHILPIQKVSKLMTDPRFFIFFLLLHFHLYSCFHSCAVVQLDVPLINTNVCVLREHPLSILHIHTWFDQTDLLDLTKQEIWGLPHGKNTYCIGYLNILTSWDPAKKQTQVLSFRLFLLTSDRWICVITPDVRLKYQTV